MGLKIEHFTVLTLFDFRYNSEKNAFSDDVNGVEEVVKNMTAIERAILGLKCKAIIDMGRLTWIKNLSGFTAQLVKYVPSSISPENHLLVAKCRNQS